MKVIQESSTYQLTFMPRLFPVSCYLVDEGEGLTLIDAALPNSAASILQAAERIGKPINRIVLTHGHMDHVGALDKLKSQLPHASVYISKRDSRLLHGDSSLDPGEIHPIKGGVAKNIQTQADVLINDGDRIGSLIAISSPGHTPGSMSFFDERNGHLIVGDSFQTRGGIAVSGKMKPLFPFPSFATWNKETAVASARKLAGLQPELLAVGHGKWIKQPLTKMKMAISEAEKGLG
ncbi:MBL fold metallo-hydrolase [Falsibacillus albus]|uniref:MBL fold metallo-hydrolase n=1 Tax=Falsibacillus albus TaxID=2478915 RepID=A0A3L7JN66_9BACI|nr:MBL fold metallo-hydrolase [Falsibacillus albus]RLQ92267.1 MBL fold metallo-hydrolase [Falsibacillus albus]